MNNHSISPAAKRSLLIILVVLVLSILSNAYILSKSQILRAGEEQRRITEAIFFQQALSGEIKITPGRLFDRLIIVGLHPKLYSTAQGAILAILAKAGLKDIGLMIQVTNSLFLLVLILSTYGIGSLLYSRQAGLLAAVLLSFSPIIFGYTRLAMIDMPLAAMVTFSFLCLLRTNNFKSTLYSIMTGIAFSLSALTKETAIVFILAPFVYYVVTSLRMGIGKKNIGNITLVIFISVALAGFVYFNPNNKSIFDRYWSIAVFGRHHAEDPFFYLKCFKDYHLGPLFLLTAMPLLLSYAANLTKRNAFLTLWLWCAIPVFSISPSRVARLIMPIVPALFLILSAEMFTRVSARIRKWYIGILVAAILLQYTAINFFPLCARSNLLSYHHVNMRGLLTVFRNEQAPTEKKLFSFFQQNRLLTGKNNRIVFIFNARFFDVLSYEFQMQHIYIQTSHLKTCLQHRPNACPPCQSAEDWMKYFLTADYIIDKTSPTGTHPDLKDVPAACKRALTKAMFHFKKIGTLEA